MWYTLAIISALFSATAAIFEKKALLTARALNFSFLLSIANLVFSIPFLFFIDFSVLAPLNLLALYGKSILGTVSFLMVMYALKDLQISSALPLLVLTPGVVAFMAFLVLGEKLNLLEIGGMLLLLLGTYVLQLKSQMSLTAPFNKVVKIKAYFFILGAVILFSATSIIDKALLSNFKLQPEAFLAFQHLFFAINFCLLFLVSKTDKKHIKTDLLMVWKWVFVVALFTIIYRYSQILAFKAGSVALVLSIKRTSVFFATLIGGHYFKDEGIFRKSLATLIMIAGAIIIILN